MGRLARLAREPGAALEIVNYCLAIVALLTCATSCRSEPHGSPEEASKKQAARDWGFEVADVEADCVCGPVLHGSHLCQCETSAHGQRRRYECDCPLGPRYRGHSWLPLHALCTCAQSSVRDCLPGAIMDDPAIDPFLRENAR